MHELSIEYRHVSKGKSFASDLVRQFLRHPYQGKVVVVAKDPQALLQAVGKRWFRIEHEIRIERGRALNLDRIKELSTQLSYIGYVRFAAGATDDYLEAAITFATPDELLYAAPDCKLMYVTYNFPREKLHMITSWMPRGGVVIIYDKD